MSEQKKTGRFGHIGFIIMAGYVILIALAVYGVAQIYSELWNLSETDNPYEGQKELIMVGSALSNLYESENMITLFMADSFREKEMHKYDSLFLQVSIQIDSLSQISTDTLFQNRLDSVSTLLSLKHNNIQQMLRLIDLINKEPQREKTITTILSKKNFEDLDRIYKFQMQQMRDTTIVQVKRKTLARRLSDVFRSEVEDSVIVKSNIDSHVVDSLLPLRNYTDTVMQYVSDAFLEYSKNREIYIQQLVYQQNLLLKTNEQITSQINGIITGLESRESEKNLLFLKEKDEVLTRSFEIASRVALGALVTALIFMLLSMWFLSRERRYRMQLEKANQYAKDLLRSRERLMLSLSHDIKAPLSSIIGYLELLAKSRLPEKEKYYVKNMQGSSEHAMELVINLLDYHRLESGKQETNKMYFSPCRLLNDLNQSFLPLASKKGLELKFENNLKDDCFYQSDPLRIRQILGNLLSNALKFTEKGEVVMTASIIQEGEQDTLVVSVKDTGSGISAENCELIFEEFARTDSSDYQGIEGSGLGLAISRKLVNLLDGDIRVESEIGKGSIFIVHIPLGLVDNTLSGTTRLGLKKNLKILFIDDDLVLLNMYTELLQNEGFIPVMCPSSIEALNILRRTPFDMVFSDIQMPDMNGFELVDQIRHGSFVGAKEIPVIALSSRTDISEQKFKEVGFSGFLSKPFLSGQLLDVIIRHTGGEKASVEDSSSQVDGFSALTAFAGDDRDAAYHIIKTFIQENKLTVSKLEKAILSDNWEVVKSLAHKLVPLMRMLHAEAVVAILCDLEDGLEDKDKVVELIEMINQKNREAEDFITNI